MVKLIVLIQGKGVPLENSMEESFSVSVKDATKTRLFFHCQRCYRIASSKSINHQLSVVIYVALRC